MPEVDQPHSTPPGRRPRRQRRLPGGRRNKLTVRLSDAELAVITDRAAEAGVSVPRLVREAALAGDVQTATERRALGHELVRVRGLVGALGNNLNQLAKVANSTGQVPAAMEPTLHAIAAAMERVKAAAAPYEQAPGFGPGRRPRPEREGQEHAEDGQEDEDGRDVDRQTPGREGAA